MPKCGRPRKITEETAPLVFSVVREHFQEGAGKIARILSRDHGLLVGEHTLRKFLKSRHWKFRRPRRRQLLTKEQKEVRKAWAVAHKDITEDEWRQVVFSDEKNWLLAGGSIAGWVEDGAEFEFEGDDRRCMQVWGCFYSKKVGPLHMYREPGSDETLDKHGMKRILQEKLLPFAREEFGDNEIKFLQDNAPVHTATLVQDCLKDNNITVIPFPPYSPDLNPIENMWAILKRQVELPLPQNEEEFMKRIFAEWKKIPESTLDNLATSMKRRIDEVIKKNGARTKY
jgi:transposase